MPKRIIIGAALAAVTLVSIIAMSLSMWRSADTVVLPAAANEVQRQLESTLIRHSVPFSYDEEQRIVVNDEELHLARSLAESEGLIKVRSSGFELFTDADYGATEFVQRINYQRALQAELERSIARIDGVRDVRVHVLQPEKSSFFRREDSGRASVILELSGTTRLSDIAPSVEELLVGAVDGLVADRVRIVSAAGMLARDAVSPASSTLSPNEALIAAHTAKIEALLAPLLPVDQLSVSVSIATDLSPMFSEEADVTTDASSTADARVGVALLIPDVATLPALTDIEQLVFTALSLSEARGDRVKAITYSPLPETAEPAPVEVVEAEVPQTFATAGFDPVVVAIVMLAALGLLLLQQWLSRQRRERVLLKDITAWVADDET